jgi:hypothetical protein
MVQPDALTVPGLMIVPAYPGAQIVHEDTDVLPVDESVVEIPRGHGVHVVAPADEYVPAGQDVHDDEPAGE